MKTKLCLLVALFLGCTATFAQLGPVNVVSSSSGTTYVSSGGSLLTSGLLRFGLFDETAYGLLTPVQQADFATVDALFGEFSTVASIGGDFNLNSYVITAQNISDTGAGVGDKMYTWVTNTSDPSLATEWGIFSSTSAFWDVKASPAPSVLNAAEIDNFVVGSTSAEGQRLAAVVPEPAHYAAILGALGLGLVMWRRRRS